MRAVARIPRPLTGPRCPRQAAVRGRQKRRSGPTLCAAGKLAHDVHKQARAFPRRLPDMKRAPMLTFVLVLPGQLVACNAAGRTLPRSVAMVADTCDRDAVGRVRLQTVGVERRDGGYSPHSPPERNASRTPPTRGSGRDDWTSSRVVSLSALVQGQTIGLREPGIRRAFRINAAMRPPLRAHEAHRPGTEWTRRPSIRQCPRHRWTDGSCATSVSFPSGSSPPSC